jgi:hypothetical protein
LLNELESAGVNYNHSRVGVTVEWGSTGFFSSAISNLQVRALNVKVFAGEVQ